MLAPDALTGYYSLNAGVPRDSGASYSAAMLTSRWRPIASRSSRSTVTTDQPEYIQGDTVTVTVQADYFSGGRW